MKLRPDTFTNFLKANGIPNPAKEYRFHPDRRWRIDYAWPKYKLAVEIEGGIWTRGRHIRGKGFLGDIEKYNSLTLLGWHLLRFTPDQLVNGEAIEVISLFFLNHSLEGLKIKEWD